MKKETLERARKFAKEAWNMGGYIDDEMAEKIARTYSFAMWNLGQAVSRLKAAIRGTFNL